MILLRLLSAALFLVAPTLQLKQEPGCRGSNLKEVAKLFAQVLGETDERIGRMQDELKAVEDSSNKRIEGLENKVASLELGVVDTKKELNRTVGALRDTDNKLKETDNKLNVTRTTLIAANTEISLLKVTQKDLAGGVEGIKAEVSVIKTEVSTIKNEVAVFVRKVSAIKAEVIALKDEVSRLNKRPYNLAFGQPTEQSSTRPQGGKSSRAVDGDSNGDWNSGSCTHTLTIGTTYPYWRVRLDATYQIGEVRVFNRIDNVIERLNGFRVRVLDANKNTVGNCQNGPIKMETEKPAIVINCYNLMGNWVEIYLPGSNRVLTLCEVQVYTGTMPARI